MVTQVVAWYVVCNGIKFTGCPRANLIDMEEAAVKSMFVAEMETWTILDQVCCRSECKSGSMRDSMATKTRGYFGLRDWQPRGMPREGYPCMYRQM